jgi:hypothetical protein
MRLSERCLAVSFGQSSDQGFPKIYPKGAFSPKDHRNPKRGDATSEHPTTHRKQYVAAPWSFPIGEKRFSDLIVSCPKRQRLKYSHLAMSEHQSEHHQRDADTFQTNLQAGLALRDQIGPAKPSNPAPSEVVHQFGSPVGENVEHSICCQNQRGKLYFLAPR